MYSVCWVHVEILTINLCLISLWKTQSVLPKKKDYVVDFGVDTQTTKRKSPHSYSRS